MTRFMKHMTTSLVLSSSLMHVFCCGVPLLMSVGSLAAFLGITGVELVPTQWYAAWEVPILVISGSMLMLTGLLQWISDRINCRTDGHCAHPPCDSKKTLSHRLFYVAVGIYLCNVLVYGFAHDSLAHIH